MCTSPDLQALFLKVLTQFSQQPYEVGNIIILSLQMKSNPKK